MSDYFEEGVNILYEIEGFMYIFLIKSIKFPFNP